MPTIQQPMVYEKGNLTNETLLDLYKKIQIEAISTNLTKIIIQFHVIYILYWNDFQILGANGVLLYFYRISIHFIEKAFPSAIMQYKSVLLTMYSLLEL